MIGVAGNVGMGRDPGRCIDGHAGGKRQHIGMQLRDGLRQHRLIMRDAISEAPKIAQLLGHILSLQAAGVESGPQDLVPEVV